MNARTLVIQPLPGIGDMVWHLPYLHAVAAASPDGKVDLLTKPRSRADQLLADDPAIGEVLWLDREGTHRGLSGIGRLAGLLRSRGYRSVWVFHNSLRYALAARLAGIPERHGFGGPMRRAFYNRLVPMDSGALRLHPVEKGRLFCKRAGLEAVEPVPRLPVSESLRRTVRARLAGDTRPWIGVGIGSSEPFKQWGGERYAALIERLAEETSGTFLLLGGPAEQALAGEIAARCPKAAVVSALEWSIRDLAGLLAECDLYVGNDTGFMNMAAALEVPAIGLFGGSPPLVHDPRIRVLLPEDGSQPWYGSRFMDRISVDRVAEAVMEVLR